MSSYCVHECKMTPVLQRCLVSLFFHLSLRYSTSLWFKGGFMPLHTLNISYTTVTVWHQLSFRLKKNPTEYQDEGGEYVVMLFIRSHLKSLLDYEDPSTDFIRCLCTSWQLDYKKPLLSLSDSFLGHFLSPASSVSVTVDCATELCP